MLVIEQFTIEAGRSGARAKRRRPPPRPAEFPDNVLLTRVIGVFMRERAPPKLAELIDESMLTLSRKDEEEMEAAVRLYKPTPAAPWNKETLEFDLAKLFE